jgi:hypothetical protein
MKIPLKQKPKTEQNEQDLVRLAPDARLRSRISGRIARQPSQPILILSPRRIAKGLAAALLILILSYLATQLTGYYTGHFRQLGLAHLVNLDEESNLPTWFSSLLLSACALLLGIVGIRKYQTADSYSIHWLALAAIFLCLSLEEIADVHNLTSPYLRSALGGHVASYFQETWVILGGLVVMIVGVSYLRFLTVLPIKIRWLFALAAVSYVGGALGMEMIRGTTYPYETHTLTYIIGGLFEEGLEMLGLVIFIYALCCYIGSEIGEIRIRFSAEVDE